MRNQCRAVERHRERGITRDIPLAVGGDAEHLKKDGIARQNLIFELRRAIANRFDDLRERDSIAFLHNESGDVLANVG